MDNIRKLLHYISPVCKAPIEVDGKIYDNQAKRLSFSQSFFLIDDCVCCGTCCMCVPEMVVLTEHEYEKLKNCTDQEFIDYSLPIENLHTFRDTIEVESHIINGKEIKLYKCSQPLQTIHNPYKNRESKTCHYLFKNDEGLYRCGIHPVRSITCRVPHVRLFCNNKGTVSFAVSQYGRNWAVGCPIKFKECDTEEKFNAIKSDRIALLEYLLRVANDLNCDTYLPEMIQYISNATFENHKQFLGKDILPIINTKSKMLEGIV